MAVNLRKGQKVALTKTNPGLKKITVGLGWDVNRYDSGSDFDLDACAFMLGANGKVRRDEDFIFYGNLQSADGSVVHTGDSLVGGSGGDDETLFIDFTKVPADVEKIVITVTIYEAQERGQNFGQVSNAYVRVARRSSESDTVGINLPPTTWHGRGSCEVPEDGELFSEFVFERALAVLNS